MSDKEMPVKQSVVIPDLDELKPVTTSMAMRKVFTEHCPSNFQTDRANGRGWEARGGYEETRGYQHRPGMVQSDNQILVQGLPPDVSEYEIGLFFGSIGRIKRKRGKLMVVIFRQYRSKSEATVVYEDPSAAQSAVQWFNGMDIGAGHPLRITMAMEPLRDGREPFEDWEGFHRVWEQEESMHRGPERSSRGEERGERMMWREQEDMFERKELRARTQHCHEERRWREEDAMCGRNNFSDLVLELAWRVDRDDLWELEYELAWREDIFFKELEEELAWRDINLKREIEEELWTEEFMELEDELAWRADILEREDLVDLGTKLERREDMFGGGIDKGRGMRSLKLCWRACISIR